MRNTIIVMDKNMTKEFLLWFARFQERDAHTPSELKYIGDSIKFMKRFKFNVLTVIKESLWIFTTRISCFYILTYIFSKVYIYEFLS